MSVDLTCPNCTKPAPAPDEAAVCPHCGTAVLAARKSDIQAGPLDRAASPNVGVQYGRRRRRIATGAGASWDADDVDIRVPSQMVDLRGRTNVAVTLIGLVVLAELAI